MTILYSFGDWVRRRRKALDLTQQQLANRAGCSLAALQKIERDERRPSRQLATLLADQLQVPTDQRDQFIQVARGERLAETLTVVSQPLEVISKPQSDLPRLNLPIPPTRLIGREPELTEIVHLFHESGCRLLTLTGPGGVGKSRLALEAAHQLTGAFKHGVYFVPLGHVSGPEFIIYTIADSLGFSTSGLVDPKLQLLNYLRGKHLLLVLDNLEHLLDGVGQLSELLQHASGLSLLSTSREPLHLQAEWAFEVQGLPIPEGDNPEDLETSSAAQLFLQRARQARRGFQLSPADRLAVLRICRLVQGLPLAIELAAAWVRSLSCPDIEQEIRRGLAFLAVSARDLPERHRSITAVFDHSWKLLSDDEQRALRQLSIFHGSFTREAAQAAAGASLAALSSLVDKSLVRHNKVQAGRYDLHELIRQYAAARLAQDVSEERAARDRHCRYYLTLLQDRAPSLRGPRQKDALAELIADVDNFRAAWDIAIANKSVDLIALAAFPLSDFYYVRDYLREGQTVFARAAVMVQSQLSAIGPDTLAAGQSQLEAVFGELLSYQAQFTVRLGQTSEAIVLYQTCLPLLRANAAPITLAHALTFRSSISWTTGDFAAAWDYLNESLAICRTLENGVEHVRCLAIMGVVAHIQGDFEKAYQLLSEGLQRAQDLGDPRLIAFVVGHLGNTAQALGRIAEVQDLLHEGLRIASDIGDRMDAGLVLEQLAGAAQKSGDTLEASRLFKLSIDHFREVGDPWFLSHALNSQGYFALAVDDEVLASYSFREAAEVALVATASPNVLNALSGLVILAARQGNSETALHWAIHILPNPAITQEARAQLEQLCANLETQLTPRQLAAAQMQATPKSLEILAREVLAHSLR